MALTLRKELFFIFAASISRNVGFESVHLFQEVKTEEGGVSKGMVRRRGWGVPFSYMYSIRRECCTSQTGECST